MEKEIDYNKPFRISLKLKEGSQPHVYVLQLKKLMEDDTSLHPMMERTLKMLKKTRTPYILLSQIREVVFDCPNFRHFDRSVEPMKNWVCTLWSKDEIRDFQNNQEKYIKDVLKFFTVLGYELFNSAVCKNDYIDMLVDVCENQIKAQEKTKQ